MLARIGPDSARVLKRSLLVEGDTTIYGQVKRVGGVTAMRCSLWLPSQSELVSCKVGNASLSRKLGKLLYQEVVLHGRATWVRSTWRVVGFVVRGVDSPPRGGIEEAFAHLREAGASDWDEIGDPGAFLQEDRRRGMSLVGLDTMILIHAVRRGSEADSPEAVEFRRRTLALLKKPQATDDRAVVSTVALAEFLKGLRPEHRGPVTAAVLSRFVVRPIDVAVAEFAADLWVRHRGLPEGEQMERRPLKVDVFVVAACKLTGASIFYSNDKACRKLAAQAQMDARNLPTHSEELFLETEINEGRAESGLEPE